MLDLRGEGQSENNVYKKISQNFDPVYEDGDILLCLILTSKNETSQFLYMHFTLNGKQRGS